MQADFRDHSSIVRKFVNFLKSTPIIYDFILDCGVCDQNMETEFKEISEAHGRCVFALGETNEEEIRNVFAILTYMSEKDVDVCYWIAAGYSASTKYQDRVKAFNERVVMVLIRHIESYLTKVGIDMGVDEKITYSITVNNGQVNVASDNSTIIATNNMGLDETRLIELIEAVKATAIDFSEDDAERLADYLEVIEDQAKSDKPKKGFVRTAIDGLKALKGPAEFLAAIAALVEFVQQIF